MSYEHVCELLSKGKFVKVGNVLVNTENKLVVLEKGHMFLVVQAKTFRLWKALLHVARENPSIIEEIFRYMESEKKLPVTISIMRIKKTDVPKYGRITRF